MNFRLPWNFLVFLEIYQYFRVFLCISQISGNFLEFVRISVNSGLFLEYAGMIWFIDVDIYRWYGMPHIFGRWFDFDASEVS